MKIRKFYWFYEFYFGASSVLIASVTSVAEHSDALLARIFHADLLWNPGRLMDAALDSPGFAASSSRSA